MVGRYACVRWPVVSASVTLVIALVSYVCHVHFYQIFATNYCSLNIFIAILSQRSNFVKRQTLRQTWIKTAEKINRNEYNSCRVRLTARFIVGDRDCPIAPVFRSDPYSCRLNHIETNKNNTEISLHESSSIKDVSANFRDVFRGFSFVVCCESVDTRIRF